MLIYNCSYDAFYAFYLSPNDYFVVISFMSFGVDDGFDTVLRLFTYESYFELEMRDYDFFASGTNAVFLLSDCCISCDKRGEWFRVSSFNVASYCLGERPYYPIDFAKVSVFTDTLNKILPSNSRTSFALSSSICKISFGIILNLA